MKYAFVLFGLICTVYSLPVDSNRDKRGIVAHSLPLTAAYHAPALPFATALHAPALPLSAAYHAPAFPLAAAYHAPAVLPYAHGPAVLPYAHGPAVLPYAHAPILPVKSLALHAPLAHAVW